MKKYLSLVKIEHTLFALPFALASFTMALVKTDCDFSVKQLILVLFCMLFARSSAMGFNRYADRFIDARNYRTVKRDIPAGKVSSKAALIFVIINCFLFIISAGLLNKACLVLSPVALVVVLGYSYTKRFTPLCHFVLGLGLSIAPMGAWMAVTAEFNVLPLLLSTSVLFWTGGFDIIYALQDKNFDRKQKLHSLPAWLGVKKALKISSVSHFVAAVFVAALGIYGQFHIMYWVGYGLFVFMLLWQHRIVSPDKLDRVEEAFFNGNSVAAALFSLCFIADMVIFG